MADPSATVVDCDGDKDLPLVRDALKYIQTWDYPAGFLRDCLLECKQHCVHSNLCFYRRFKQSQKSDKEKSSEVKY